MANIDPIYKLNGRKFTKEQLEASARHNSVSFDDYVSSRNFEIIQPEDFQNGAVENNAPATPKNNQALNNGDSDSENGSSDLPGNLEFGEVVDFDFNDPYSEPKKERRYIQFKSGRVYEDTYLSELEENPTDKYNREKPKTFEEYAEQMGGNSSSIQIYKPDTFVKEQKSADARVIEAINSKFEQTEEQKLAKRADAEVLFVPQADRPTHTVFTGNYTPPEQIVTKNEDYDKYVGIAKNRLGNNASEDEILSVAKNLYVDASVKPQIAKNIEQSLKEGAYNQGSKKFLNTADSDFIKDAAAREYKIKNEAQQANVTKLEGMGVLIKATTTEMDALLKGTYTPEEGDAARERYKYLRSTLEVASENYNEFYNNSYLVTNEELEGLADIVDVTKRVYGLGNVLAANVVATASELIGGALKAPEWLGTIIESAITGEEYGDTWMAQNTGMISEALLDTEMIRGSVAKPVDVADIESDGTNFGYWMTDLIGNQIPTAAAMIAFPASSLYVMGASSLGQKANDMAGLMESGEASYNNWQMLAAPVFVGGLEYVTEKVSLGQLKHVKKIFRGKNGVEDEVNKYIQERVLNKNYFVDVLGEGSAEGINQLGNNVVDITLLKNKDVHIWDGVPGAIVSGAFMSGAIYKAPGLMAKALHPFASKDLRPKMYSNIVMQEKIAKELAKNDISPSIKSSLKQSYDKLTEDNAKLLNDQFKAIDALTDAQKTELIEIDKSSIAVQKTIAETASDNGLSPEVKDLQLANLKAEKNAIDNKKAEILATIGAEADIELTKTILSQASGGSKVVVFENDPKSKLSASAQQEAFLIENDYTPELAKSRSEDYGLFVTDKNGNDILVINKSSALEDKVVTTGKHEFLHKVLKNALASNPELAKSMGSMLLQEIKANPNLISNRGKYAIKVYKDRMDDVNDPTTEADYFEEIVTVFSESINEQEIQNNATILSKLADIFRRIFNERGVRNIKFKTSKDVINFVRDYNRDFAKGKLSSTLQGLQSGEGEIVSGKISSSAKIKKPTVLQTINELVPVGITTKEELQKPRVFNRIYEATLENGAISNYVKSRSENKAVYEKAIESIQERLINYDPAAVRKKANGQPITFGEFIFANTNFGKLDAKKKLAIESKEAKEKTSVDSKEAKQVADTSEAPVRVAEKPKYKNLVQSKVVSTDALKSISSKIGKIVRTLKSRMDAKTSLNKTVSPLIAEIKKEMGKQADIDLKKEIGGKKDGQIKKYLLANKKAILENMTTTWLMQAMPGAIQKQVDGKFTSDWKGKKIDREKVSTNAAGKTSGAEIVRRLPNPSVSLDDAAFLGYIIDKKGAPIRGRKESLAKAMAEEISFDIFSQQIKDPESDISKAFEANQERLGVVIAENIVEDLTKQIDRGTVKFSAKIINYNKENSNFIPDFLEDMRSATFRQIFSENYRNEVDRPWFDSAMKYFGQKFDDKKSKEYKLTIAAVKDVANDFAMKNNNKKLVEVAVKRTTQTVEEWEIALDAINEKVEDALTLGIAYDTVGMIYTGRTNQFDDASLDGINEARYALKALVDSLAEKGMTRNEIRAAFKDAYVGPGGIGKFTVGNKEAMLTLTDKNLGDFKGGSRGAIVLNAADFDNNFLKDVKNEGPKVVNDSNIFKKDYWTKPTSKFNKMDSKGKWSFLKDLFNKGVENQVKLEKTIESIKDLDVSAANKRWLIRGLFASMPALGKATSTTRYVLVNNDGSLVSFEELKRKGLATKDDKGVFEHTKPANRVSVAAYAYAIAPSKATKTALDNELKDFDSALISEKMDKVLVGLKLQSKMGLGYKVGTGPMLSRYRELISELDSKGVYFYDIKTNKKILPATKFSAPFLATAKAGSKSSAKISGVTEGGASTFVPNVKGGFSKSSTGLKAIFMVGGPGAGKTNVGKGLQLGRRGYKVVNQDIALEAMKTEAGLPAKESDYDAEQRSTRSKIGAAARKAAVAKFDKYADNGNGMVIDGTGASYNATTKKIKALQAKGFEVHMVVASTPLSTAIERNRARTERSLPDFVVEKTYDQVQESLIKYRKDFEDRLYEINTESIKYGEALPGDFLKQVYDGINKNIVTLDSSVKSSVKLSKEFNDMIERGTGTLSEAKFSSVVAKRRGARKGRFKVWMPTSLDDFKGLTSYVFAGKGRQGDADQKWFQDNLIDPYFDGIAAIEVARQTMTDDFKALNKMFKPVVKALGKLTKDGDYTNDQAIRIYLWDKAGYEIPGLSKRDLAKMLKHIENNPDLKAYADAALVISKQDKWSKPGSFWDAQTILSDLGNMTEKTGRKEYIAEFIENAKEIFSEANMNKIEAVYGTRQTDALKDILYRMENGTNRPSGMNKNANKFNNWVNNSIGSIMFFNRRSALLQTLSTVNFINWSDNNPLKAAAAFANQPQFWKDFSMLFNSPKLKQRRAGLKSDINEAEIASAVKGSKNKAVAALSWLLKKGFMPTQIADSFAIASGGATFYRNRVKSLVKQGKTLEEAEAQAFKDFSKISEETQQSGDPALISSDQASTAGRMVLAFQNTPIQLNRSIKKSAQDLYNRRRAPGLNQFQSDVSNISKILYYGAAQNIIFSALQNALFYLLPGFDDEEPTDEEFAAKLDEKSNRILNGIISTTLKGGFGIPGAVVDTIKNVIQEYNKQDEKGFTADHTYTILQGANLAPPIGSKLGKIYKGIQAKRFNKDVIENRGYDVFYGGKFNISPAYSVLGNVVEGSTNFPMARAVDELNSITEAFDTRNTVMQRIALGLGWKAWNVGATNEEHTLIKTNAKLDKEKKKKEERAKGKKKKAKNKPAKDYSDVPFHKLTPKEKAKRLALKRAEIAKSKNK